MKERICIVAASEWTLRTLLLETIRALSRKYDVTLVSTFTDPEFWRDTDPPPACITLPIARPIRPVADARALFALFRLLRRGRFDAVHSVNPKAGLLVAVAGFLVRVPIRIHTFSGQVWATRKGSTRTLLKSLDRLIAALNTHILVDGRAQLSFLHEQKVLPPGTGRVLANGSMGGVDLRRFRPDATARREVRRDLEIPDDATVIIFLGRLNPEKGVLPMARAFSAIAKQRPDAWLLIVGEDETGILDGMRSTLGSAANRLRLVSYTNTPERFLAASDLLCQPSLREGFSTIVVEAAAVGLPAVASRVYGLIDPVGGDEGGILVPPGDAAALASAMLELIEDPARRRAMGQRARARVVRDFGSEVVVDAALRFYEEILVERQSGAVIAPEN